MFCSKRQNVLFQAPKCFVVPSAKMFCCSKRQNVLFQARKCFVPSGRTSGPADRSKGCTFNVLPRLTRPAPVLARLATVRQVSPPKTYTASLGRNPVPRHLCSSGEPLSTLCSCLGTLTSRYTPDRPYEGPTRSVGNFGPRYHDCCARPWCQGSN